MKRFLFLTSLILFISCSSSPKAIITAEIKDAEDQMVYLTEALGYDAKVKTVTDSVKMVDGVFTFSLDNASARRATITFAESKRYFDIVIEEGTQTIKCDFGKNSGVSIKGTFIADKINEFKARQRPFNAKIISNSNDIKKIRTECRAKDLSTEETEELLAPYRAIYNNYKDSLVMIEMAMIEGNKDNLFSVYQNTTDTYNTVREIDEVIAKIPENLRDNGLFDFIARRRAALARVDVGAMAPDFTMKTLDGEDFTLSSLKGKVVLINTWAST